ncbi:MAG: prolipoprotein diacylglyceryl transferase [Chloroflexi bacterium]|nr:prolipoprotein diacylglyceryl transferase [Chloroflexota bacterium]
MDVLATISIGINPNILDFGPFLLSWHGFLTFISVALAVYLVHRWATREGLDSDSVLSVAVWSIIGGIVGARVVHVIDFWSVVYQHNPLSVFYVWQGGIAIYGAILGGFAGGSLYIIVRNSDWFIAFWEKLPGIFGQPGKAPLPGLGHLADITAPALLIAMAIGRIGDVINGEHFASFTRLPWGVIYTHANSPGLGRAASHPAVVYELIFDLLLVLVLWPLRNRLRPQGMVFALFLGMYSTGRFFISFLRQEFNTYFLGLNEAQLVALLVVIVVVPLLVYKAQFVSSR